MLLAEVRVSASLFHTCTLHSRAHLSKSFASVKNRSEAPKKQAKENVCSEAAMKVYKPPCLVLRSSASQAVELKAELRERGLRVSGKKAELITRLEAALQ